MGEFRYRLKMLSCFPRFVWEDYKRGMPFWWTLKLEFLQALDWVRCDCHIKSRFVASRKHHWYCNKRQECCCCCARECDPPCEELRDE